MSATLAPSILFQPLDANGNPLPGGKVWTYAAGTSTPLATYTDATGTVEALNPITLNANGQAVIYLGLSSYKINVLTADGVQVPLWPRDNIDSVELQAQAIRRDLLLTTPNYGANMVAYRAPYADAQDRTQADKNLDTVTGMDFMPLAQRAHIRGRDFASQNPALVTAALQRWLDEVPVGACVTLPPGDYYINGTLTRTEAIHLRANGARIIMANTMPNTMDGLHLYPVDLGTPGYHPRAGWTIEGLEIAPELETDTPGRHGLFVDVSPLGQGHYESTGNRSYPENTNSLQGLTLRNCKLGPSGSHSARFHESAIMDIDSKCSFNGVRIDVCADTTSLCDCILDNGNPAIETLVVNCYEGANKLTIDRNSIVSRGGKELARIINAGTMSFRNNQLEPQQAFAGGVTHAVVFEGRERPIVGPDINGNNFNTNFIQASILLDNVAFPRLHYNQYSIYPGYAPAVFETTDKCWGLDFKHNTNVIADPAAATQFGWTQDYLNWNQPGSINGSIAGTTLTVSAISNVAEGLAPFTNVVGNLRQNLYGTDIAPGTQVLRQLTGATPGGLGTYEVSISQTVTSRAMLVQYPTMIDNGHCTMGVWKYPTLHVGGDGAAYVEANGAIPSSRYNHDQPAYRLANEDTVEFAGGCNVTVAGFPGTPTADLIVFQEDLPVHMRPNYEVIVMVACETTPNTYETCALRVSSGGGVYLHTMPLGITKVMLDGASYRRGRK